MDILDEVSENESKNGKEEKVADDKVKKKVVIDENNQVKTIEARESKEKGQLRQNFETTDWLWRISVISFLIGYLFQVLSYGTPYWLAVTDATGDVMAIGIWSSCQSISSCTFRNEATDCVNSVRIFGGVGVICGLVVTILLYMHIKKPDSKRCLGISCVTLSFISALSTQISTAIFGRTIGCSMPTLEEYSWTWSLALAITAIILTVASGLMFLIIVFKDISRQNYKGRIWRRRGVNIT
ncbi:uncharacterized protein LOC132717772 [Ruditapes philippinarum]|uniref:uncharacterized protein LOC132717772 n=1 Tax=Ruditapes philippinarum TaxID=129788 RepID=UPI00295C29A6|nr:uncharacterized protein LOC132717772 [Ruditapes philippinarum]